MNITRLALRRPVTIGTLFACVAIMGLLSARLLPLEYFPDIEFPIMWVEIPYQNSSAEDVERRITRPVEEMLATLGDIKRMRSESRDSGASIFLFFEWGEELGGKAAAVRDKLDAVRARLPNDVERIILRKFDATSIPILTLRISSERDLSGYYDMLDRNLKRRIERLEGVGKVDLYGVWKKQLRVELSASRIAAHGIDLNALREMLMKANFSVSAGQLTDGTERVLVRPIGEYQSVDDVAALVVAPDIRLGDIADIRLADPVRTRGRHLNRTYAVGLDVFKETGVNMVAVADRVIAEIEEIGKLPEMKGIQLFALDNQAQGVRDSLSDLMMSGLIGALLSIVVLYYFLRQFRMTLIVTMAVPFSLLVTLASMYFLGYTMNILTMMGLMLSVGMLVDNAVVVAENIFHKRAEMPGDPVQASAAGVAEVSTAILAGTLTTVIVFLPNIIGQKIQTTIFLSHVAVTICISLVASLVIAKTLIPLLVSRTPVNGQRGATRLNETLQRNYRAFLGWSLDHRGWVMAIIGGTLAITVAAMQFELVKMDFFPQNESKRLFLRYNVNNQYALEKVEQAVDTIETYLFENKQAFQIDNVYSFFDIGRAESTILLRPEEERTLSPDAIKEAIREKLPKIAIGRPSFDQQRSGSTEALSVQVYGESTEKLRLLAEDVRRVLASVPGFTDLEVDLGPRDWEVQVEVNRERARRYGFSSQMVAEAVAVAMRGQQLKPFRGPTGEVEMLMQFRAEDRRNLDRLMQVPIKSPGGELVSLGALADWRIKPITGTIRRDNRATAVSVKAALQDISSSEARKRIEAAMKQLDLPSGYGWRLGRSFDEEEHSEEVMAINMLLALAMIYIVMAALFESLLFPLSIITTIFFSFLGAYWFFGITGTAFTIMAAIGLLILMGIVVNNGIVLIDHVNHLRWSGLDRREAILQGARDRMRPILMTAGTTVLGLVPLALGGAQIGGNGPPYFPMARAIMGGLLFSTVATLLLLPALYTLLDDLRDWSAREAGGRLRAMRSWFRPAVRG